VYVCNYRKVGLQSIHRSCHTCKSS